MLSEVKCSPLRTSAPNVTISSSKTALGKIHKDIIDNGHMLTAKTLECNIWTYLVLKCVIANIWSLYKTQKIYLAKREEAVTSISSIFYSYSLPGAYWCIHFQFDFIILSLCISSSIKFKSVVQVILKTCCIVDIFYNQPYICVCVYIYIHKIILCLCIWVHTVHTSF